MIRRRKVLFACLAVLCLAAPAEAADDRNATLAKMMMTTKLIAVPDWAKPASDYIEDKDPDTLEVVFLQGADAGPGHVSDDGEVIFIAPNATDEEQQTLTTKAFEIRLDKRSAP
ncbi:MAG TPA: hypothetical protein VHZ78_00315 [Rhizomicrobium sp.]|jgi:hypothetical protein|nr:hypothetical protein [Rhizomicrobium sp.]